MNEVIYIVNGLAIITALISGYCWMRAAYAKDDFGWTIGDYRLTTI
jgi:hypothetical protein